MTRNMLALPVGLLLFALPVRAELTEEQREALTTYFENNSKFVELGKKPLEALESLHADLLSKYSDALLVVRISNDLAETRDWEALKKLAEKLEDAPLKKLCPNLHNALGWIGWVKSGMELLKDLVIDPALEQQAIDIYVNNRKALDPGDAYANSRVYGLVRLRNIERFRKQYGDQPFEKGSKDKLLAKWDRRLEEFSSAWFEAQYQLRMVEEARRGLAEQRRQAEKALAELDRQLRSALQDKQGQLARASWNEDRGEVQCVCLQGYRWEGGPACVADKAAQVATADCSNHPGSRPYWDDGVGAVQCGSCRSGQHWARADGADCEPDADPGAGSAGGDGDELAANIGRAAAQIFDAEVTYGQQMQQINDVWGRQRSDLDRRPGNSSEGQASDGPDLGQCVACVNGLVGGGCYARVPSLAGWGLCISCRDDGGVEEKNRHIDRDQCPRCLHAGWKLENFREYRHN